MSYTVLARRYRSKGFDEVIGQEPIAKTLQNAIKSDRVAHAYLFCGTRGVGKTSMARIFAKALAGGSKEADAAIMAGKDTDVIEIDGASNNKVDDARELIANSVYRPLRGKKKVYIIDEVHMLSTAAFNALLKTMEEPPEHVVFILCTTEPQKVPPTIQSRCQRFDFRNIPSTRIAEHLAAVVKDENHTAEPELLHSVARLGNGSMRDALSLMDRLLAAGTKKLTVELLEELLGLPDRELVGSLIDSFADGDPAPALKAADELLSRAISIEQLLETLLERFRDLMVIAACGEKTTLVDLSDESRKAEAARAARFDAAGLVHMIALTESVQRSCRSSPAPRALFDALLVRLALTEKTGGRHSAGLRERRPANCETRPRRAHRCRSRSRKKTLTAPEESRPPSPPEPARAEDPPVIEVPNPVVPEPRRAAPAHRSGTEFWSECLRLAATNRRLRLIIEDSRLVALEGGVATVTVGSHLAGLARNSTQELTDLFSRAAGEPTRLVIASVEIAPPPPPPQNGVTSVSRPAPASSGDSPADAAAAVTPASAGDIRQHPLVKQAEELFGARVVRVDGPRNP